VAAAERDAVVGVVDFAGLPVVDVVDVSAELFDLGRVVLVVEVVVEDDDFDWDDRGGVVVVVEDFEPDGFVVVVVVDFEPDGLVVVVVVVDDFDVGDFDVGDFDLDVVVVVACALPVVEVVAAVGTLGSSLAVDSSSAWVGPVPAAGGATAGGGIFSSRKAYCMIRANTGADTWPP
jgi:hypothetical protein